MAGAKGPSAPVRIDQFKHDRRQPGHRSSATSFLDQFVQLVQGRRRWFPAGQDNAMALSWISIPGFPRRRISPVTQELLTTLEEVVRPLSGGEPGVRAGLGDFMGPFFSLG